MPNVPVLSPRFARDPLYIRAGQVPAVDWRFAQDRSLVDRIRGLPLTFTRTTGRTFEQADGSVGSVGVDAPAFSFSSGVSRGLDVWEARTNLALRSEEFDNASWTKNTLTVTANNTTGPDGTSNADLIAGSAGTANKFATVNISTTTVAAYTFSIYLKQGTERYVEVRLTEGSANGVRCRFDLSDGSRGSVTTEGTATATSAATVALGNGWYRCIVTCTVASLPSSVMQPQLWLNSFASNSLTTNYWAWGAQLELGSNASPYIATAGSTVQRTADVCSTTDLSWYNASGGVFYVETLIDQQNTTAGRAMAAIENGTSNSENIYMHYRASGATAASIYSGGILRSDLSPYFAAVPGGTQVKQAQSFAVGASGSAGGGVLSATGSPAALPSPTRLNVGFSSAGSAYLSGTISRLAYFPPGAAANNLQRLTA